MNIVTSIDRVKLSRSTSAAMCLGERVTYIVATEETGASDQQGSVGSWGLLGGPHGSVLDIVGPFGLIRSDVEV